jgi:hypothetical protein
VLAVLVAAGATTAGASPTPSPSPEPAGEPARGAVTAYSEFDSRFADIFNNVTADREFGRGALVPYAAIDFDYDTRSGVPGVSEIYNDNAAVARAGYRFALDPGGFSSIFATAGYSFGLRGQASFPETRYGIEYARDFESGSNRPTLSLAADATAYSRYAGNIIGAATIAYETPLLAGLRTLTGAELSLDDRREYDNNYAEAYGGVSWPIGPTLALNVEGVVGTYLSRGIDTPSTRSYSGLRVRLDFSEDLP